MPKRTGNAYYAPLREALDQIPVIDTHEHFFGGANNGQADILWLMADDYSKCDLAATELWTEGPRCPEFSDPAQDLSARWAHFDRRYQKARHTGYLTAMRLGMEACWGMKSFSLPSVEETQARINQERSRAMQERLLDKFLIRSMILDYGGVHASHLYLQGSMEIRKEIPRARLALGLPAYHCFALPMGQEAMEERMGRKYTDLDTYLNDLDAHIAAVFRTRDGFAAFKEAAAYWRKLNFDPVDRGQAARIFRETFVQGKLPEGEDYTLFSNYMFRHFVSLARENNIPIQVHTGYPQGLHCGSVTQQAAENLTSVINEFRDVRFDLFHANYPMQDTALYLAKNAPNVTIDFCWAQGINPLYSVELMKSLVVSAPQNSVIAFGGDGSCFEHTIGYLILARDNVASALSELIALGYLSHQDALEIAADWFFNNPNEVFQLGYEPFTV